MFLKSDSTFNKTINDHKKQLHYEENLPNEQPLLEKAVDKLFGCFSFVRNNAGTSANHNHK